MATHLRSEKNKIRFADGATGWQTVEIYADGRRDLSEIVVTALADGTRCENVYGPRRYLDARVFSFSDLHATGHGSWKIAQ